MFIKKIMKFDRIISKSLNFMYYKNDIIHDNRIQFKEAMIILKLLYN